MKKSAIVWFRNDLRLHDNEALLDAILAADQVIPVYIFDERVFKGKTSFGFRKTAVFRARFIIESIEDLRKNLRDKGSDLIVRIGRPEDILFELAEQTKSSWIFCNRERTDEEVKVQDRLEKKLWTIGRELRFSRGKMLYYTADLPFPVTHTPDVFSTFRKEVENFVQVREPLETPARIPFIGDELDAGDIPDLQELGYSKHEVELSAHALFSGGETQGLKELNYYIWQSQNITVYKESRNLLFGRDYSSKFSPYLAQGCLSPKIIYWEVIKFENQVVKNESTYWLIFELLWRDFFRLMGKKHGNNIFKLEGTKNIFRKWEVNRDMFASWSEGQTGLPFIDANMRQLNSTGYMSNRGRQNVASFLVNDLGINWLMGAEYFESLLVDYDPCSNYGNWNYIAGVGSDTRETRYFNVVGQGKKYDPNGKFIMSSLPVLRNIPLEFIHEPFELSIEKQSEYGCILGKDYPFPIVSGNWA